MSVYPSSRNRRPTSAKARGRNRRPEPSAKLISRVPLPTTGQQASQEETPARPEPSGGGAPTTPDIRSTMSSELGMISADGRLWYVHEVDANIEPLILEPDDGGYLGRRQLLVPSRGSKADTLKRALEVLDGRMLQRFASGYTHEHLREDTRGMKYVRCFNEGYHTTDRYPSPADIWNDAANFVNPAAMVELLCEAYVEKHALVDIIVRELLPELYWEDMDGDTLVATALRALPPITNAEEAELAAWTAAYTTATFDAPEEWQTDAAREVARLLTEAVFDGKTSHRYSFELTRAVELCLWGEYVSTHVLRYVPTADRTTLLSPWGEYGKHNPQGVSLGACKDIAAKIRERWPWKVVEQLLIDARRAREVK